MRLVTYTMMSLRLVVAAEGIASSYYEFLSSEKNKGKNDKSFDKDLTDHRLIQQQSRVGTAAYPASIGLQWQSSGSSNGEISLSGEYYILSPLIGTGDPDAFGHLHDDVFKVGGGGGGDSRFRGVEGGWGGGGSLSSKSWAQQTEESYHLQLALALRLSFEATCADDPNFLDPVPGEYVSRSSIVSLIRPTRPRN
ncbi:hypothetical protein F0562_030224 [Nyssa sinensis]|uniref:Uncharacterized protein n=1 Tax=Nyssa sinensis TaxID=561372 RepID=A0A5J5B273_9ASTE|nr:hypothetical protein F0562_030224 [Nyssa sinensis]